MSRHDAQGRKTARSEEPETACAVRRAAGAQ